MALGEPPLGPFVVPIDSQYTCTGPEGRYDITGTHPGYGLQPVQAHYHPTTHSGVERGGFSACGGAVTEGGTQHVQPCGVPSGACSV